jgi:hypothetical protein
MKGEIIVDIIQNSMTTIAQFCPPSSQSFSTQLSRGNNLDIGFVVVGSVKED